MKIYVSPSDQHRNLYAVGDTNEKDQCHAISAALIKALVRCGMQAKTNYTASMQERVKESNEWGADLHLPIHTNAFNGKVKGTRLFCYNKTGEGYRASVAVMSALAPITPGESDSITVKHFYEVKYAHAPTVYLEVGFHDNKEEAKWMIENTEQIAEAICQGVCDYFGVKYEAPGDDRLEQDAANPEEPEDLYRVQVGAFSDRKNALAMLDKLKAAGFDGFIT
jgi:N-acetylmuramoyl-L-alanine amidase